MKRIEKKQIATRIVYVFLQVKNENGAREGVEKEKQCGLSVGMVAHNCFLMRDKRRIKAKTSRNEKCIREDQC